MIIGYAIYVIVAFIYSISYLSKYTINTNDKQYVSDYINSLDPNKEICLVLRPFGNDGSMLLSSGILPKRVHTIEELVRDKFIVYGTEVVSIQNPGQKINIGCVKTIKVSDVNNWKKDVTNAIKRSSHIVFLFPKKSKLSGSVKWEIKESYRHLDDDKILFIFGSGTSHIFHEISRIIPEIDLKYKFEHSNIVSFFIAKKEVIIERFLRKGYLKVYSDILDNYLLVYYKNIELPELKYKKIERRGKDVKKHFRVGFSLLLFDIIFIFLVNLLVLIVDNQYHLNTNDLYIGNLFVGNFYVGLVLGIPVYAGYRIISGVFLYILNSINRTALQYSETNQL